MKKMQMTCAAIIKPMEDCIGMPYMLWPDGGFHNGGTETPVEAVMISWMPSVSALEKAGRSKCNVMLCHEPLYFSEKLELPPYRWLTPDVEMKNPERHPNFLRRKMVEKYGLTVIQCHYGLDRFCHFKAFADAVGLGKKHHDQGWETVFELPKAVTVQELADQIRKKLKICGTMRVVGDLKRKIRLVANLWGGEGLVVNQYWVRRAIENGAECGICGEMDEFFMHYAKDAGFCAMETSHQLSEEQGMKYYASHLAKLHPSMKIHLHLEGRPYQTV